MAWKETTATAWNGIEFQVGTPGANNAMATSFASIGRIKEMSLETEEGDKKEWKDINGDIVDELTQEGKLIWNVTVKNLNKSNLEKFWDIEEDGPTSTLKIKKMSTSKKYSVKIINTVQNAEVFSAAYCSVTAKPTFGQDDGYLLEIKFTVLDPGNGKEKAVIGQTA